MKGVHFNNLPFLFLLWIIPVIILIFVYASYQRRKALSLFADKEILDRINTSVNHIARNWKSVLIIIGVFFIIFGLARPGWNPKPRKLVRKGRDVVFVIDVSKSMLAADIAPNRLERAKIAIIDCVERLEGDRVGLVAFAGSSIVKCPLTLDYGFFRTMVEDISVLSIARGGTKIGDALRKVLKEVFDNQEKQYKDIILITDGEDHDSFPLKAAEALGERGVRLIAIGLGDENTGQRIPVRDKNGQITFLKYRDDQGNLQEVWSKLDADMLRKMANVTNGGRYLNVATGNFDLGTIYANLVVSAEKRELESKTMKQYEEKFQIFLIMAFFLFCLELLIHTRKRVGKKNA